MYRRRSAPDFIVGICWLVSGILPCSDFYLGATVSLIPFETIRRLVPSETIGVFILQFGGLNLDLVEVLVEDPRVVRGHSVRYLPSVIIYYHKPAYMSTLF